MLNKERQAGILLHITSLPSKYGIGTLGSEAYSFVDYISDAGLKLWQILPLSPTSYGDSPYQAQSSVALNHYLIDFDLLQEEGLLDKEDYENIDFGDNPLKVDYYKMFVTRIVVLRKAYARFNKEDKDFIEFCKDKEFHDYALFMTVKGLNNYASWTKWPAKYRNYTELLEEKICKKSDDEIKFWMFTQFVFLKQWNKLKEYANSKNIKIIGDIPLYIGTDSVEVWKYSNLFIVDKNRKPTLVSGCPPDCFTALGQLWGNPIYNWDKMKEDGYTWWKNRIYNSLKLYDILRIDHFRGFDKYYAIEAHRTDAIQGVWLDGPKFELFKDMKNLNIIAEDLGFIDYGVRKLMKQTKFPGMKILEFAFDSDPTNENKPSTYTTSRCVVYTGTHDNLPIYQYIVDMHKEDKKVLVRALKYEAKKLKVHGSTLTNKGICRLIIKVAFASMAGMVIIPMQDYLLQGEESRMNLPSTVSDKNWRYRIKKSYLNENLQKYIHSLVKKYER